MSSDLSEKKVQPIRRDEKVLKLILAKNPELYVNIVGEPCISLPLDSGADQTPWLLNHNRVRATITGFAWDNAGLVLHAQELNRLLRVLESRAWMDQRTEIELEDAIDDDPLLEGLLILLASPESNGSVRLTATKLLQALNKKARLSGVDTDHHAWPKAPTQLSRRLGKLDPLLLKAGISVQRGRDSGGVRFVHLSRGHPCDDIDSAASQPPSIDNSHHPKTLSPCATSDGTDDALFLSISVEPEGNKQ